MLLNLKQIGTGALRDEKTFDFEHILDLSAVRLWGEQPFISPVSLNGSVTLRNGVFTIRYNAAFEMSGRCSRCLASVTQAFSREFEHIILMDPECDEISERFISAPDGELDLDGLATSDLLLEYGGVMLCGEDCNGICAKCGKNLNEGNCGCNLSVPDPRFDALRKLLGEQKE